MNKVLKWILIGLGIAIVVFLVAMAVFSFGHFNGVARVGRFGGYPVGRMGGFMMLGLGFGLLRGLFWLVLVGLAIYGIVALFSRRKTTQTPPPAPKTCSSCGKVVHDEWVSCPYCGNSLKEPPASPDNPQ